MTPPVSELLSIPVVPGVSAVFVGAEAELAAIRYEGEPAKIVASHRIHGLSQRIIVCLVADAQFRDGSTVTVQLKGRSGEHEYEIPVRLASWRQSTTAKVVRFIASKILPRLKSTDHSPFERFLSLSAGWRETIPAFSTQESIFALIGAPSDVLAPEMSFYSVRDHHVTVGRAAVLSIDDGRALINFPKDAVGRVAYIGAEQNLIELEIGNAEQGRHDLLEIVRDLPAASIGKVLDWVEELGHGAAPFVEGITGGNPNVGSVADLVPGARLLRCIQTAEKLILFMECDDGIELDELNLTPAFEQKSVRMSLAHRFVSKAPGKRRFVASSPHVERRFLHRLAATINGETTSRWIRTEKVLRSSAIDFALNFWSIDLVDDGYLSAIVLPLLAAEAKQFGANGSSGELTWRNAAASGPRHEVTIVSAGDIEALKRSIYSLASANPHQPAIRVFLTSPARQELVAEALANIGTECGLDLSLDVFPPRAFLWVKKLRATAAGYSVLLKEGVTPARPDWFEMVRAEFDRGDAVFTATNGARPGSAGERFAGLAMKSAALTHPELDDLRCLTFDGFCRTLTYVLRGKPQVRILPTLPFIGTANEDIHPLAHRFDSLLLRQSAKPADRSKGRPEVGTGSPVVSIRRREKSRSRGGIVNR